MKIPQARHVQPSSPGKKSPPSHFSLSLSLSFFFFLLLTSRKQSINQNQTLWHPGPLDHGKPPYTMLHWKKQAISPHQLTAKLLAWNSRRIGEHHTLHATLLLSPWKIIQHSHWADWAPTHSKTEKHKTVNCNLTPTAEVGVEGWTCPENGARQGAKFSVPNCQWSNMHIKQQRLRAGAGQQGNLPKEPPALSRDRERHKGWEWG
jgi:hypothetical protein